MNDEDKKKMAEVGQLSVKYGEFIARNIVDVKYVYKKAGIKGIAVLVLEKVKRKINN